MNLCHKPLIKKQKEKKMKKTEKKTFKINDLHVKSFVTGLADRQEQDVRGGATGARECQWKTGAEWC